MPEGTILLVHGTGVRLPKFRAAVEVAKKAAVWAGIEAGFAECAWGDPLGVEFEGLSLPDPPSEKRLREDAEDFACWSWLFDDPLFELHKLTIRSASSVMPKGPPGRKPEWLALWEKIRAYRPSQELDLLLQRGGLRDLWPAGRGTRRTSSSGWSTTPNGPDDPSEQMVTLRDPLGDAAEPENAAANLLEWMGGRMQAGACRRFKTQPASLP